MILNSDKWKKVEQLFNHGKTKTSLGFLALVNTEFSSEKWNFSPFRMEKVFWKQFSGEFNETNFENPSFAWEFNFVSCEINEIFPPQKFLLLKYYQSVLQFQCRAVYFYYIVILIQFLLLYYHIIFSIFFAQKQSLRSNLKVMCSETCHRRLWNYTMRDSVLTIPVEIPFPSPVFTEFQNQIIVENRCPLIW